MPLNAALCFRRHGTLIDIDDVLQKSLMKLSPRWERAAEFGWYPGEHTNINLSEKSLSNHETLSSSMISRIEKKLSDIEASIVNCFPQRKIILVEAFMLHRQGRFIAAIPLFLSQTEGIFQEGFQKSIYSRKVTTQPAFIIFLRKESAQHRQRHHSMH